MAYHNSVLRFLPAFLAFCLLTSGWAHGATFNEGPGFELSGNPMAPTALDFSERVNRVNGIVGGTDLIDSFTFVVWPGQRLSEVRMASLFTEEPGGRNDAIFFYVDDGPSTTFPSAENAPGWLGGVHLTDRIAMPSDNLLDLDTVTGHPPIGELGPSEYTVGVQQNGPYRSFYQFEFEITGTALPEPVAAGLLVLAAVCGSVCRRR